MPCCIVGAGILIYEMLMGYSPFADHAGNDQRVIYSNIMKNDLRFPSSFRDATTKDLIRKLLMFNPTERLGCLAGAAADVRAHAFFDRVDWVALLKKAVPPPIRPEVHSATDTSNFDDIDADLRIQRYDGGSGDAWDAAF
ncbi:hypothetical protein EON66_03975 [archaeon]|nr:MAG: hypothetical protein EON66_03975 [archaeon]